MSEAHASTDHDHIRQWADERGCRPATVRETAGGDDPGVLRFDCGSPDDSLEEISWDEFFDKFDKENLALLHQHETDDGSESRFFKFVERSNA